eukprot:4003257-Prymnesium_polylepis.1
MAGAAGHASQALCTLSGRMARSHTQRSECVPHVQHRHPCPPSAVRIPRWCGEGWWEGGRRGWACVRELLGCGIWPVLLSTYQRDSSR